MLVSECMTKNVELGNPEMTLVEVAKRMRNGGFGALPIGEDDRWVGLITDRDIVVRAIAEGKDAKQTKVRDIMTRRTLYCFDDQTLDEVKRNMGEIQVRRLVVLNRQKRVVGILSMADFDYTMQDAFPPKNEPREVRNPDQRPLN